MFEGEGSSSDIHPHPEWLSSTRSSKRQDRKCPAGWEVPVLTLGSDARVEGDASRAPSTVGSRAPDSQLFPPNNPRARLSSSSPSGCCSLAGAHTRPARHPVCAMLPGARRARQAQASQPAFHRKQNTPHGQYIRISSSSSSFQISSSPVFHRKRKRKENLQHQTFSPVCSSTSSHSSSHINTKCYRSRTRSSRRDGHRDVGQDRTWLDGLPLFLGPPQQLNQASSPPVPTPNRLAPSPPSAPQVSWVARTRGRSQDLRSRPCRLASMSAKLVALLRSPAAPLERHPPPHSLHPSALHLLPSCHHPASPAPHQPHHPLRLPRRPPATPHAPPPSAPGPRAYPRTRTSSPHLAPALHPPRHPPPPPPAPAAPAPSLRCVPGEGERVEAQERQAAADAGAELLQGRDEGGQELVLEVVVPQAGGERFRSLSSFSSSSSSSSSASAPLPQV